MSNQNENEGENQNGGHGQTEKPAGKTNMRIAFAQEIEENLKRVYQASLTEPVPDRFAELLAQLREKDRKQ